MSEIYKPAGDVSALDFRRATVAEAATGTHGQEFMRDNISRILDRIRYLTDLGKPGWPFDFVQSDALVSRNRTAPWDDFDAADGTLVNGRTTPSGHVWACEATGPATIDKGGFRSAGNVYATLTDSQVINEVEGVFSFTGPATDIVSSASTIMFSRGTTGGNVNTLDKLIHCNFGPTGFTVLKTLTGAANLAALANPPSEVNGVPLPTLTGSWLGGPLRVDGTRYKIRMVVDLVANTLTVYGPDGLVYRWQDNDISSIVGNRGVWQIGGENAGVLPICRWHECALGPSKAGNVGGGLGPLRDSAKINSLFTPYSFYQARTFPLRVPATGNGWYTIAVHSPASGTIGKMGGFVTVWGEDVAGRKALCRIKVGAEAHSAGTATAAQAIFSVEKILGQWSGGWISQVRLSQSNTGTGSLQLDVNVQSASSSGAVFFATFDGEFTPQASAVGATPLGTWSTVLDVFPFLGDYLSEQRVVVPVSGAALGYFTVAKQLPGWQVAGNFSYMGGRVIVQCADNAGRRSAFEASVSHAQKSKVPVLTQLWAVGDWAAFPVPHLRCSTDDTNNLCNLDIDYQGNTAGAYPPNYCQVILIGFFVPVPVPVTGAAALPTNSTVLTIS